MLSNLYSYFDSSLQYTKKKNSKYIYRDELDKKATPLIKLSRRTYHKLKETKSPLLGKVDVDQEEKMITSKENKVFCKEKKELRVKIRMTREEAVRLLSKCKQGGLLEFSDVAHELNKIPMNRVGIVDSTTTVHGQVLDSIAEEI